MNKKEEFKAFASNHPELLSSIKSGEMTWQKYYEIYDIYGDKKEAWDKYLNSSSSKNDSLSKIIKNIDMESIQNHINTAQKALGFISELTSKSSENLGSNLAKGPTSPINKFFGD